MSIKKNILVLTPATPDPSYIDAVLEPLEFLKADYQFHALDSLELMQALTNEAFYQAWRERLLKLIPSYHAFFGFSFGGVILQQCFSLFHNIQKPIILFSTPSFADPDLNYSLKKVIQLCETQQLPKALHYLYQQVYYPNEQPSCSHTEIHTKEAAKRVIYGLNRVLTTDSRTLLAQSKVKYLHLIGEHSQLVTTNNVVPAPAGILKRVPQAGMGVLRDNPSYCHDVIWEALNEGSS